MNISFDKVSQNKIRIYGKDKGPIYMETPILRCPFGLEKSYDNYLIKLQINEDCCKFVEDIEKKMSDYLELDEIKTQIQKSKNYLPLLICKLPYRYNKFECNVTNIEGNYINPYKIEKNTKMKCVLYLDNIWKYNDNFYYRWKVKDIVLQNCVY